MRRSFVVFGSLSAWFGVACATGGEPVTEQPAASEAAVDPKSAIQCPGGLFDANLDPADGCEYACTKTSDTDEIDPGFRDDNCDGTDGIAAKCIFVSASGVDAPARGSNKLPMKTIGFAVDQAKRSGKNVCLAGEVFEGTVKLSSGVSLYGGFNAKDQAFPFKRSPGTTSQIAAEGTAVLVENANVDTHVEGLFLNVRSPKDTEFGASTYGVRALGGSANLYVRYNSINVAAGRDGAPGLVGDPGAAGASGSNGSVACSNCSAIAGAGSSGGPSVASTCGGEASGAGGQGGHNYSAGKSGGSVTGAIGGGGGGGGSCTVGFANAGSNGSDGKSALVVGSVGQVGLSSEPIGTLNANGEYVPPVGAPGAAGGAGRPGAGGGGGGGGPSCTFAEADRGAGGGAGGTGGCGGVGGYGGQGGGGSFGIVAYAGSLVVGPNSINAGPGGSGSVGGPGGVGGAGGKGGSGGGSADDGKGGGKGGDGSQGGMGGAGGGGAGGPSACLATAKGVKVVEAQGSVCKLGGGGTGGGNAPAGQVDSKLSL